MLRMFAVPPEKFHDADLAGYFSAQGIDPKRVTVHGLHWTELPDGSFALHFLEFVLDADGNKILCPAEEDGYHYGQAAYFVKRPRLINVADRPALAIEVAR